MGLLDDLVRGGRRKAKEVTKDVNEFIEKHDLDDKFEDAKEATIKGVVNAASAIEKGTPVVTAKVAKTINKGAKQMATTVKKAAAKKPAAKKPVA
ncbi:MAG: hypothetical protein EBQ79_01510, partial [Actinobacteria bacterium]|nr:hypothetical protein [Actinomycetota bacterium]